MFSACGGKELGFPLRACFSAVLSGRSWFLATRQSPSKPRSAPEVHWAPMPAPTFCPAISTHLPSLPSSVLPPTLGLSASIWSAKPSLQPYTFGGYSLSGQGAGICPTLGISDAASFPLPLLFLSPHPTFSPRGPRIPLLPPHRSGGHACLWATRSWVLSGVQAAARLSTLGYGHSLWPRACQNLSVAGATLPLLPSPHFWKVPRQLPCPWAVPTLLLVIASPLLDSGPSLFIEKIKGIFNLLKIITSIRVRDVPSVRGSSPRGLVIPLPTFLAASQPTTLNPILVAPCLTLPHLLPASPGPLMPQPTYQGHRRLSHLTTQFLLYKNLSVAFGSSSSALEASPRLLSWDSLGLLPSLLPYSHSHSYAPTFC